MTEGQTKLLKITEKLNYGDAVIREQAADEMMNLVRGTADVDNQVMLANQIIDILADFNHSKDWNTCYQLLSQSTNPLFRFRAIFAKVWMLKKKPTFKIDELIIEYQEGLKLAEEIHYDNQKAEFLMHIGKCYLLNQQFDDALAAFTQSITVASNVKNYSLVAIDTYYIAILLHEKGLCQCAIDKMREASNLAIDNTSKGITQQTEVIRAYYTLLSGNVDETIFILKEWYQQFGIML